VAVVAPGRVRAGWRSSCDARISSQPGVRQRQHQPRTTPRHNTNREQERGGPAEKRWRLSTGFSVSPKQHKVVADWLGAKAKDVDFDAVYEAAAIDYAEHGEPADLLSDLKKRARAAIPEWSPIPSWEESRAREARMKAEHIPLTPEEKAQIKALFKGSRSAGEKILENTSDAAAGRS
jgi:hypothetical protein